jgi:hypothetical protein
VSAKENFRPGAQRRSDERLLICSLHSYVIANVNGQLERAFKQLATLHTKFSFSFAIAAGNLFSEDEDDEALTALLEGRISVPVDTYFTVGTRPLPARVVERILGDEEICENLHYLGKRSVTKTTDGLRIVTLGGLLDMEIVGGQSKEQHLPFHTADDARALKGANSADILLTSVWPTGVAKGSKIALSPEQQASIAYSEDAAELCTALKPRYYFTASLADFAYEREPFAYPNAEGGMSEQVTRFISLAPYRNPAKAKSSYAFHLPRSAAATAVPADLTMSPFALNKPRKRKNDDANGYSRFGSADDHRHHHKRRGERRVAGPEECFFCIARPEFTDYMVAALGDETYLSSAKGPLPKSSQWTKNGIQGPTHMLMAPIEHAPTVSKAALGERAEPVFKEMTRIREALQTMVISRSKCKLGGVTWEINRDGSIHAHWQFMPAPADMILKGLVEAAFKVEAENQGFPKLETRDFGLADEVGGSFVRIWLSAGRERSEEVTGSIEGEADQEDKAFSKSLVMRFDDTKRRFDLQFVRRVMAKLLRLEDRLIWRDVAQTEEEEKTDIAAFRKAFSDWDFTGTIAAE